MKNLMLFTIMVLLAIITMQYRDKVRLSAKSKDDKETAQQARKEHSFIAQLNNELDKIFSHQDQVNSWLNDILGDDNE